MFANGQQVVCINGEFAEWLRPFYTAFPIEGNTYTVRAMTVGYAVTPGQPIQEGELCVYLVGLVNPQSTKAPFKERGFNADRFRPLEEQTETNAAAVTTTNDRELVHV